MNQNNLLLSLLAITALAGCKDNPPAKEAEAAPGEAAVAKPVAGKRAVDTAVPVAPSPAAKSAVEELHPILLTPDQVKTPATPDVFQVEFETTKGNFTVEVRKDWAPLGAERFYNLVQHGFFTDLAFFRAIDGFMVQFGISGSPKVAKAWREATFPDDPVKQSNKRGRISFATSGPDSRTTQIFINYADNFRLDKMGFAPFAVVVKGMEVVDALYKGYGEGAPGGKGPSQGRIQTEGNDYLRKSFPELDYIKRAKVVRNAAE
ncbi:MAG TPA: peptidylprolyl isomerase [Vulgatibacter sp.]